MTTIKAIVKHYAARKENCISWLIAKIMSIKESTKTEVSQYGRSCGADCMQSGEEGRGGENPMT